jgi:hypothetical protein
MQQQSLGLKFGKAKEKVDGINHIIRIQHTSSSSVQRGILNI